MHDLQYNQGLSEIIFHFSVFNNIATKDTEKVIWAGSMNHYYRRGKREIHLYYWNVPKRSLLCQPHSIPDSVLQWYQFQLPKQINFATLATRISLPPSVYIFEII